MDEKHYTLALKYLQRRPRSEKEVVDYLKKKNTSDGSITTILGILRKQKFVNDEEFARWWIDQRTRFKPKGRLLITLELQQKGISPEVSNRVYEENNENIIPDEEKAKKIVQKTKKYNTLPKQERYKKLATLLQRKGFDYSTIYRVLRTIESTD